MWSFESRGFALQAIFVADYEKVMQYGGKYERIAAVDIQHNPHGAVTREWHGSVMAKTTGWLAEDDGCTDEGFASFSQGEDNGVFAW